MREPQPQKLHRQHAWNDCPPHMEKKSEAYEETSSTEEQNRQLSTINKEKEEIAHHDWLDKRRKHPKDLGGDAKFE